MVQRNVIKKDRKLLENITINMNKRKRKEMEELEK